jgi:hypothetical protein
VRFLHRNDIDALLGVGQGVTSFFTAELAYLVFFVTFVLWITNLEEIMINGRAWVPPIVMIF